MVDKPKTYPQKIAELQEQITLRDDEINDLKQQLSFVEEMQNEILYLREQLQARDKDDQSSSVGSKVQINDLKQRAEAAEAQLRELRKELSGANMLAEALEQQLEIAGAARDKNLGKDQKIEQLAETIKQQNNQIASFNLALADSRREATEQIANAEKQANYYRQVSESLNKEVQGLRETLENVKRSLG